ncbi:hypothetical protein GMJAKD_01950 [Candidatus Electrothrix aarhusensis]
MRSDVLHTQWCKLSKGQKKHNKICIMYAIVYFFFSRAEYKKYTVFYLLKQVDFFSLILKECLRVPYGLYRYREILGRKKATESEEYRS